MTEQPTVTLPDGGQLVLIARLIEQARALRADWEAARKRRDEDASWDLFQRLDRVLLDLGGVVAQHAEVSW